MNTANVLMDCINGRFVVCTVKWMSFCDSHQVHAFMARNFVQSSVLQGSTNCLLQIRGLPSFYLTRNNCSTTKWTKNIQSTRADVIRCSSSHLVQQRTKEYKKGFCCMSNLAEIEAELSRVIFLSSASGSVLQLGFTISSLIVSQRFK